MIDHQKPDGLPEEVPEPQGIGSERGEVMGSRRHLRSDARLAARLLSLGVIPEEQAAALLKKGFGLAASSSTPRDYAAAMQVPLSVARLELEKEKLERGEVRETGDTFREVHIYVPSNGRFSDPGETPRIVPPE